MFSEPGGWLIEEMILIDYHLFLFSSEPRGLDSNDSKNIIMSRIVHGSGGTHSHSRGVLAILIFISEITFWPSLGFRH